MALKKEYSNNKKSCRVTFTVTKKFANNFKKISLIGDFNNWDPNANLFSKVEADGSHTVSIVLLTGNEYHFRYLCDDVHWFNELEADKQIDSYYEGSKNSVLVI